MAVYYCSIEDIEKQLSTPILIQLTSDNGQDVTNRVVAKEAIIYASALIDGYLRGRYNLPLNTRFPLLRVLAIDISIYRLYSRRVHNGLPEQIEDAYKNAIATLRDIQKRSRYPARRKRTNKDILSRIFNRHKLSEY